MGTGLSYDFLPLWEQHTLCIGLSLNEMPHRTQQNQGSYTTLMDLETLTVAGHGGLGTGDATGKAGRVRRE